MQTQKLDYDLGRLGQIWAYLSISHLTIWVLDEFLFYSFVQNLM